MYNWSLRFLMLAISNPDLFYGSIAVAICNLLIQTFFDMAFGSKSMLRLGRKG